MTRMNAAYDEIIAASDDERRDLFVGTARRLGTTVQNVEKDFWVCWILDALFNGLPVGEARLLFKGGTSLSKAYGLIDRFSEDVDITVFRDDLGQHASLEELEVMSGKKRQARLDAIKASCQAYITGPWRRALEEIVGRLPATRPPAEAAEGAGGSPRDPSMRIVRDDADPDGQTLLFWYPSALGIGGVADSYVRPTVKIELGAKSALDPHHPVVITPYVAADVPRLDLRVPNVTTVDPERTFWDKVVILHGVRRWYERRGILRAGGQRVSRHYYDLHRLLPSDVGRRALVNRDLGRDCARHARMFFNSPDLDLVHAIPGTFALVPEGEMRDALRRDYDAMATMIFGLLPAFDDVMQSITALEAEVNMSNSRLDRSTEHRHDGRPDRSAGRSGAR